MKKLTLFTIFTSLTAFSFAQELSFGGDINTLWAAYAPRTENAGSLAEGLTKFNATVEAVAEKSTAIVDATLSYSQISKEADWTVNEAYVDYTDSFWGIRAGVQKIVWGKADGVSITDSVFPKDTSSVFVEDNTLPVDGLRLSLTGESWTLDALWLPVFRASLLPQLSVPVEEPETTLKNSQYGFKLSGYYPLCDISLYGFYGFEKTPLVDYANSKAVYEKLTMAGFDAAFPVKSVVLRLEGAVFPQRKQQLSVESFMKTGDSTQKQTELMALAGLDWMPDTWTITAQYFCSTLVKKAVETERDLFQHGATLSISKALLQETLELSLSAMVMLKDFDSAAELSAAYKISDQIKAELGSKLFFAGPENDGTWGAYKDFSCVYLKAGYWF